MIFFINDTATTEIYTYCHTLALHYALPILHHGQGIQEIFYHRDDVYYVSIHGDPENFYPVVAGYDNEKGAGAGFGYNLNLPMPHGSPESVFLDRKSTRQNSSH